MPTAIYDENNKRIGHAKEESGGGALLLLVGGLFGAYFLIQWLAGQIVRWEEHSAPYRYIAAYYDCMFGPG